MHDRMHEMVTTAAAKNRSDTDKIDICILEKADMYEHARKHVRVFVYE